MKNEKLVPIMSKNSHRLEVKTDLNTNW